MPLGTFQKSDWILLKIIYFIYVNHLWPLKWLIDYFFFIWILLIGFYRLVSHWEPIKFISKFLHFFVWFCIFRVCALISVQLINKFIRCIFLSHCFGNGFIVSKEILKLLLEFNWIIKFTISFWTFYLKPTLWN